MRHKLLSASCMVAVAVIGGAAPAYADPNPHGNSCQGTEVGGGNTPGNAATSPGSVFNEPPDPTTTGFIGNSANGGKGGQAYNNAQANNKVGAAAQYDTACHNTLKTGTGTPMQTAGPPIDPVTGLPTDITNNSKATRAANGVISHTGNGVTK